MPHAAEHAGICGVSVSAVRPLWAWLVRAGRLPRAAWVGWAMLWVPAAVAVACSKPVYLTFDTGHMGVAPLVAEVLKRNEVRVTFFLARERTLDGGHSLDEQWAQWWRERVAEGHEFGSHTWNHVVWTADLNNAVRVKVGQGEEAGRLRTLSASDYCDELRRPAQRFEEMTGRTMAPLFRAPAGRTSPALLEMARQCGFHHVGWSDAGFLGDELPSDRHPNAQLLQQALQRIRSGDILVAHLGIWSRKQAWAPEVLEPLVLGLKERGFCFRTLASHPRYAALWANPPHPPSP